MMIDKRILDYYINRKRRNYPSIDDLQKLNVLENLFKYSNWIDIVGKEKYQSIMNFLNVPNSDIIKYYNDYVKMKESFLNEYINIYPEDTK